MKEVYLPWKFQLNSLRNKKVRKFDFGQFHQNPSMAHHLNFIMAFWYIDR